MKQVLLLRFGELFLKGRNIKIFERQLVNNIKEKLLGEQYSFHQTLGRYIVSDYDPKQEDRIIDKLCKVFGLISLSRAVEVPSTRQQIEQYLSTFDLKGKTYRVSVKRADKSFPISSMDYAKILGTIIWKNNPNPVVDLYNPQVEITVDIRTNGRTYILTDSIPCQGGLPLGSSGQALLLLSGGIDSPVAGYMMAKRGLKLSALHFYSYPYTSQLAKEKVVSLAKQLSQYVEQTTLYCVSFTKVQEQIHMKCAPEYMITIMRRIMMRVAERLAKQEGLGAIITGESLGQVASQTMASITVTGNVVQTLPVFRPCIALDKQEIMAIANKIGTYETSILPYEDCCTVFLPKNPVIKPTIEKAEREESFLNVDQLVNDCLASVETIEISPND